MNYKANEIETPETQLTLDSIPSVEETYDLIKLTQLEERELYLTGEICMDTCTYLIEQIRYLNTISNDPITIYINSPGGDVTEGFALIDCIRNSMSPICAIATGQIMSMAIPILACCDAKLAGKYCHFMVHSPRGHFSEMNFSDIQSQQAYLNLIIEQKAQLLSEHTKLTKEQWIPMISGPEIYFNSEKALEYGLIDEII